MSVHAMSHLAFASSPASAYDVPRQRHRSPVPNCPRAIGAFAVRDERARNVSWYAQRRQPYTHGTHREFSALKGGLKAPRVGAAPRVTVAYPAVTVRPPFGSVWYGSQRAVWLERERECRSRWRVAGCARPVWKWRTRAQNAAPSARDMMNRETRVGRTRWGRGPAPWHGQAGLFAPSRPAQPLFLFLYKTTKPMP